MAGEDFPNRFGSKGFSEITASLSVVDPNLATKSALASGLEAMRWTSIWNVWEDTAMADKLNIPPAVFMMHRRQFMMTAAAGALAAGSVPLMAFGETAAAAVVITPATPLAGVSACFTLQSVHHQAFRLTI